MQIVEPAARHFTLGHALATPPITATALAIFGVALSDWVYIVAIISGVISMGYTSWRWVRDWRAAHREKIKPTTP